jgi:hypothetical protein
MDIKNMKKNINNSLQFLDNEYIYCIIVVILVLYNSLLFMNINDFFSNVYKFGIIRVIVLLLILYISQKSYLIALLFAMSYILSIYFDREKVDNTENFLNDEENSIPQGINDMDDNSLIYDSQQINPNHKINNQNNINVESMKNMRNEEFNNMMNEEEVSDENMLESMGNMNQEDVSDENMLESMGNMNEEHIGDENMLESMGNMNEEHIGDENMLESMGNMNQKHISGENMLESMGNMNQKHISGENMLESMTNKNNMKNNLSKDECIQNYTPLHESVGNVCEPVATFKDEYNAQGLNYPIGYNIGN